MTERPPADKPERAPDVRATSEQAHPQNETPKITSALAAQADAAIPAGRLAL